MALALVELVEDCLSLGLCSMIKQILYMIGKHGRKSKKDNQHAAYSSSCWQNIPAHIMETIVKRLKGADLVRMGCVCKSWRQIHVLCKDIWVPAPDIPWLLLSHKPDQKSLSFYSMSKCRFYNMKLSKRAQGGWICGNSKGWLAVVKGSDLDPHMFLLNPVSREQIELHSLINVDPYYSDFADRRGKRYNASDFVRRIEVFSGIGAANFTVVAAIFGWFEVLAFCKLGDKRWSIFEQKETYINILFYDKCLYALIESKEERVSTHTISLKDCALELKLIPRLLNEVMEGLEDVNQPHIFTYKEVLGYVYLVESIHGELIEIHHIIDSTNVRLLEDGELEYEVGGDFLIYDKTKRLEIFKVNPNSGHMEKLTSLGEQALFCQGLVVRYRFQFQLEILMMHLEEIAYISQQWNFKFLLRIICTSLRKWGCSTLKMEELNSLSPVQVSPCILGSHGLHHFQSRYGVIH